MDNLLLIGAAGFAAALIDGSLGMGFGPTSSAILLGSGLSPATTAATVNVAKVVTGVASGASHWRFGNVDRRLMLQLAVPGAIGALIGASLVTRVDGSTLRPILALLLVAVAIRMIIRFALPAQRADGPQGDRHAAVGVSRVTAGVGALGGLTNGLIGAWGPVVTPYLLGRQVATRTAVGSVTAAEVFVAAMAVAGVVSVLRTGGPGAATLLAMVAGGLLGAPLSAWVAARVSTRALGLGVGAVLLVTQLLVLNAAW
jgi:uncharacterized protein